MFAKHPGEVMFTLSRIAVTAKASAIFTFIIVAAAGAGDIGGIPRIVDGDTVQIAATKIRLSGIDAPETDQLCLDARGLRWTCGVASRDELVRHAGDKPWTCHVTGTDRYGRSLASCDVGGENIEQWMVRNGWALSLCATHTSMTQTRKPRAAHALGFSPLRG